MKPCNWMLVLLGNLVLFVNLGCKTCFGMNLGWTFALIESCSKIVGLGWDSVPMLVLVENLFQTLVLLPILLQNLGFDPESSVPCKILFNFVQTCQEEVFAFVFCLSTPWPLKSRLDFLFDTLVLTLLMLLVLVIVNQGCCTSTLIFSPLSLRVVILWSSGAVYCQL